MYSTVMTIYPKNGISCPGLPFALEISSRIFSMPIFTISSVGSYPRYLVPDSAPFNTSLGQDWELLWGNAKVPAQFSYGGS